MTLSGHWCRSCGTEAGFVKRPGIPADDYSMEECDGCGERQLCAPAYFYKITVHAARKAIAKRERGLYATPE